MEKVPIHCIGLRFEPIWRWTSTFLEADEPEELAADCDGNCDGDRGASVVADVETS